MNNIDLYLPINGLDCIDYLIKSRGNVGTEEAFIIAEIQRKMYTLTIAGPLNLHPDEVKWISNQIGNRLNFSLLSAEQSWPAIQIYNYLQREMLKANTEEENENISKE